MVVGCFPTTSEEWGRGGIPRKSKWSHASSSGPEIKYGRCIAKDGAPERLRCGTIQEEVS